MADALDSKSGRDYWAVLGGLGCPCVCWRELISPLGGVDPEWHLSGAEFQESFKSAAAGDCPRLAYERQDPVARGKLGELAPAISVLR